MSEINEPDGEGDLGETRTLKVNPRRTDIATGLDREHVDGAIKEWRDIGPDAFHAKYETRRAYKFVIVESDGAKFDAKAILFGARRRNGLDGRNTDFRGDEKSVAEPLMALGYTIEEVQEGGVPEQDGGFPQARLVPLEAFNQEFAQRKGVDAGRMERSESQLVGRIESFLSRQGYTLARWQLSIRGEESYLYSDLFCDEKNELFEAKSSAHRDSIRMAIGQLWDYKRLIGREDLQITVLVPEKPNDDLLDLCDYAGVGCMYETSPNIFERHKGQLKADQE